MEKRRTLATVSESTENTEIREKIPVRWWVEKKDTEIANNGVTVVIKYKTNVGWDKQDSLKVYSFTDDELDAVKANDPDENSGLVKVGLTRALSRRAQDKFRKEIDQKLLEYYHKKGLDETVQLFAENRDLNYLLRGFAYFEAKMAKLNVVY